MYRKGKLFSVCLHRLVEILSLIKKSCNHAGFFNFILFYLLCFSYFIQKFLDLFNAIKVINGYRGYFEKIFKGKKPDFAKATTGKHFDPVRSKPPQAPLENAAPNGATSVACGDFSLTGQAGLRFAQNNRNKTYEAHKTNKSYNWGIKIFKFLLK